MTEVTATLRRRSPRCVFTGAGRPDKWASSPAFIVMTTGNKTIAEQMPKIGS
jgi:hypothetical protein